MAKEGLRRCAQCHEIKATATDFPTTNTGKPNRNNRGHGEWCLACCNEPDPTMTAGARRAAREKKEAARAKKEAKEG